jgi:TetR/AcrR family transcriptional repressor of nem operon
MSAARTTGAKERIVRAGTELFRRNGFVATTVEEICQQAGLTKGAFFHHFQSKEALAEACLQQWDCQGAAMDQAALFQAIDDPLDKLLACMDFYISLFMNPALLKSCLAGTTVQEVSETHPTLRAAANQCFVNAEARFKTLLDDACKARRKRLDTASLAALWMATIQGSLLLCKAARNETVIGNNLHHVKTYIANLLETRSSR